MSVGWITIAGAGQPKATFGNVGDSYLYYGNLPVTSPQYKSNRFYGLALKPACNRDIFHDAYKPLPLPDNSVTGFQSEDVFEHLIYDSVPSVLNEIYRCMKPGGLFRLSLPDYNCGLLRDRSVFNSAGEWLCDPAVGGSVKSTFNGKAEAIFSKDGDSHLWAPTLENVTKLISHSSLCKAQQVYWQHGWLNPVDVFKCECFDQSIMPVQRTPPKDMRANGNPVSIVIDFVK